MTQLKQSFHYRHFVSWSLPLLALGFALVDPELALATTDFDPWGSSGGNGFRTECPKGSYLVGLDGRAGDWVDKIAAVCAPWLPPQQTFGAPSVGRHFGASTGGKKRQSLCWGFGINNRAVQSLTVEVLRSDNKFVQSIGASCTSLAPPVSTAKWGFGSIPDYPEPSTPYPLYYPDDALRRTHVCPSGEVGVGIHGRAGMFVDALGLICGPLPVKPPMAATKVTPLAKAPVTTDDMFTIVRPAENDRIVQGQLVIMAKPPKVGATSVTVLEFRRLDAPPTEPPITFAVETPKLLQGYLVDQQVTRGNAGRWEVRARIAAQPVAGPWSLPVRFQLVVTQQTQSQTQTSPIQQTSPLPSSSVTQPSPIQQTSPLPSSSVVQPSTQGSAASSLMIRPRGVEEKGSDKVAPERKP